MSLPLLPSLPLYPSFPPFHNHLSTACPSPPAPEAYVRRNYTGKGVDGDTALYVCAGMFDSGNDTVEISCSSGNWSLDVLPECGKGEEIGELGEIGEEG